VRRPAEPALPQVPDAASPKARGPRRTRRRPAALTDRDRCVLALLAEHRVLHEDILAAHLGVSRGTAVRRIRRLAAAGSVRTAIVRTGAPAAVWVTRPGLQAIGSRLPAPVPDLRSYRHDIGVGWLWLAARRGAYGELRAIVSERAMRSHDTRLDREGDGEMPRFAAGLEGLRSANRRGRHYPDLLLRMQAGHDVAIELELTRKSPRRLEAIMRAYASDPRFAGVVYLLGAPELRAGVELAALRAGAGELIRVCTIGRGGIAGAGDPARGGGGRALALDAAGHRCAGRAAGRVPGDSARGRERGAARETV
jgi:DNA-binding Lrp family transcriptional regulator